MKKNLLLLFALFCFSLLYSQENTTAFKDGEYLRFKMSYSGFLRAGTATLSVQEKTYNGKEVYHTIGKGWTSGMIKWFFEVDDTYESYFDKNTVKPYLFKRKIDEGGYKKHRITAFNHNTKTAYVQDFINQKDTIINIKDVQDMLSSFYYLRTKDFSNMKGGEEISLDMFFDDETYAFKLRLLGRETISTSFGKVKTLLFRPIVQSGRVFKEQESVTIWITDDANKIPIRLKASLAVGSLRADLEDVKGLANPMNKL